MITKMIGILFNVDLQQGVSCTYLFVKFPDYKTLKKKYFKSCNDELKYICYYLFSFSPFENMTDTDADADADADADTKHWMIFSDYSILSYYCRLEIRIVVQ